MSQIYESLRERAREIAARLPMPALYTDFEKELEESKLFLIEDRVILDIHQHVSIKLENNFGHGVFHAEKVAIDAGLLVLIEGRLAGLSSDEVQRLLRLVQTAGLLHDIKRKHKDHPNAGACFAEDYLTSQPFTKQEIDDICTAIRNHEAFKKTLPPENPDARLISDALYDGDKFRWGQDNFTHTVWDMLIFSKTEPQLFLKGFPKGMEGIKKIRTTFRTQTGKKYGPNFINDGIEIGNQLYTLLQVEGFDSIS